MTRSVEEVERDLNDDDAWGEPVRTPKSNKRQRDAVVSVRFTPSELSAVQGLASERNAYISTLLRELALQAATVVQPISTLRFGGTPIQNSALPTAQSAAPEVRSDTSFAIAR